MNDGVLFTSSSDRAPADPPAETHEKPASVIEAAMQVGALLGALQTALYHLELTILEEQGGDDSEDGSEAFNDAFGDVARLYARLAETTEALIEDIPEAQAARTAAGTATPPAGARIILS